MATPLSYLSDAPKPELVGMVQRLTAALEGLISGGRDGSTSGDRIHEANQALDEVYRLSQYRSPSITNALLFGHDACDTLAILASEQGLVGARTASEWRAKGAYIAATLNLGARLTPIPAEAEPAE